VITLLFHSWLRCDHRRWYALFVVVPVLRTTFFLFGVRYRSGAALRWVFPLLRWFPRDSLCLSTVLGEFCSTLLPSFRCCSDSRLLYGTVVLYITNGALTLSISGDLRCCCGRCCGDVEVPVRSVNHYLHRVVCSIPLEWSDSMQTSIRLVIGWLFGRLIVSSLFCWWIPYHYLHSLFWFDGDYGLLPTRWSSCRCYSLLFVRSAANWFILDCYVRQLFWICTIHFGCDSSVVLQEPLLLIEFCIIFVVLPLLSVELPSVTSILFLFVHIRLFFSVPFFLPHDVTCIRADLYLFWNLSYYNIALCIAMTLFYRYFLVHYRWPICWFTLPCCWSIPLRWFGAFIPLWFYSCSFTITFCDYPFVDSRLPFDYHLGPLFVRYDCYGSGCCLIPILVELRLPPSVAVVFCVLRLIVPVIVFVWLLLLPFTDVSSLYGAMILRYYVVNLPLICWIVLIADCFVDKHLMPFDSTLTTVPCCVVPTACWFSLVMEFTLRNFVPWLWICSCLLLFIHGVMVPTFPGRCSLVIHLWFNLLPVFTVDFCIILPVAIWMYDPYVTTGMGDCSTFCNCLPELLFVVGERDAIPSDYWPYCCSLRYSTLLLLLLLWCYLYSHLNVIVCAMGRATGATLFFDLVLSHSTRLPYRDFYCDYCDYAVYIVVIRLRWCDILFCLHVVCPTLLLIGLPLMPAVTRSMRWWLYYVAVILFVGVVAGIRWLPTICSALPLLPPTWCRCDYLRSLSHSQTDTVIYCHWVDCLIYYCGLFYSLRFTFTRYPDTAPRYHRCFYVTCPAWLYGISLIPDTGYSILFLPLHSVTTFCCYWIHISGYSVFVIVRWCYHLFFTALFRFALRRWCGTCTYVVLLFKLFAVVDFIALCGVAGGIAIPVHYYRWSLPLLPAVRTIVHYGALHSILLRSGYPVGDAWLFITPAYVAIFIDLVWTWWRWYIRYFVVAFDCCYIYCCCHVIVWWPLLLCGIVGNPTLCALFILMTITTFYYWLLYSAVHAWLLLFISYIAIHLLLQFVTVTLHVVWLHYVTVYLLLARYHYATFRYIRAPVTVGPVRWLFGLRFPIVLLSFWYLLLHCIVAFVGVDCTFLWFHLPYLHLQGDWFTASVPFGRYIWYDFIRSIHCVPYTDLPLVRYLLFISIVDIHTFHYGAMVTVACHYSCFVVFEMVFRSTDDDCLSGTTSVVPPPRPWSCTYRRCSVRCHSFLPVVLGVVVMGGVAALGVACSVIRWFVVLFRLRVITLPVGCGTICHSVLLLLPLPAGAAIAGLRILEPLEYHGCCCCCLRLRLPFVITFTFILLPEVGTVEHVTCSDRYFVILLFWVSVSPFVPTCVSCDFVTVIDYAELPRTQVLPVNVVLPFERCCSVCRYVLRYTTFFVLPLLSHTVLRCVTFTPVVRYWRCGGSLLLRCYNCSLPISPSSLCGIVFISTTRLPVYVYSLITFCRWDCRMHYHVLVTDFRCSDWLICCAWTALSVTVIYCRLYSGVTVTADLFELPFLRYCLHFHSSVLLILLHWFCSILLFIGICSWLRYVVVTIIWFDLSYWYDCLFCCWCCLLIPYRWFIITTLPLYSFYSTFFYSVFTVVCCSRMSRWWCVFLFAGWYCRCCGILTLQIAAICHSDSWFAVIRFVILIWYCGGPHSVDCSRWRRVWWMTVLLPVTTLCGDADDTVALLLIASTAADVRWTGVVAIGILRRPWRSPFVMMWPVFCVVAGGWCSYCWSPLHYLIHCLIWLPWLWRSADVPVRWPSPVLWLPGHSVICSDTHLLMPCLSMPLTRHWLPLLLELWTVLLLFSVDTPGDLFCWCSIALFPDLPFVPVLTLLLFCSPLPFRNVYHCTLHIRFYALDSVRILVHCALFWFWPEDSGWKGILPLLLHVYCS